MQNPSSGSHELVGGWPSTPLKNDGRIVSWDDFSIPNWMETNLKKMFQTTKQIITVVATPQLYEK